MNPIPHVLRLALVGVMAGALAGVPAGPASFAQPAVRPGITTTVGIEAQVLYRWDGPTLRVKPAGPKSIVLVRLADVQQDGLSSLYDLRLIALKPGTFDARDWLERADGLPLQGAPAAPFTVRSTLPLADTGELRSAGEWSLPALGGYRWTLIGLGALWSVPLALVVFRALTRRRRIPPSAQTHAPPTLADQLRPLVARSLAEDATTADRAALERVLIAFWRDRLDLAHTPISGSLALIRRDPAAAALLTAVEEWLHAPRSTNQPDVERLLEPYKTHPPVTPLPAPDTSASIDVKPARLAPAAGSGRP